MTKTRTPKRIATIIVLYTSLFMAVILLVMSIVSYYYSYNNLRNRTISDTEVILTQVGKNIGRYMSNIKSISSVININTDLKEYLSGNYKSESEGLRQKTSYEKFLRFVPEIADGIEAIFIFDRNNQIVYKPEGLEMKPGYDITQEGWFQKVDDAKSGTPVLTGTQVRVMTERNTPWVLSLSSRIVGNNGQIVGTQLIELNYRVIDTIVKDINIGTRGYVFIIDEESNYVYHPQLQLIYSGLKSEDLKGIFATQNTVLEVPEANKLYSISTVPGTDFKIVGVMYLDEIVAASREMITIYVLLVLVIALAAFIGSVQMAKNVTKPLDKLEKSVKEVEQGNLNANFDILGTYETEMFAKSLGSMVGTVNQLMNQIMQDQEMIRTSELKALQSQINPHFLYNTLDSIVWISEEAGNQEIKEITLALASYFRIVLSAGKDIIPVRDEVEHVRNYLFIQKMRYENLDYQIDVEEEVLGDFMPKLLLQPIVENAIYHGIKNNTDGGKIWIRGFVQNGSIRFEIRDNGRGMRPTELKNIFDHQTTSGPKRGGVGLRNIRERIELYFGQEYGVSVESTYRKGTVVTVKLPAGKGLMQDE